MGGMQYGYAVWLGVWGTWLQSYLASDPYPAEQALMSLFVLSSKDGWVNIMYDGLDAVGIDQQVCKSETALMGNLEQNLYVFGIGASYLRNVPQNFGLLLCSRFLPTSQS